MAKKKKKPTKVERHEARIRKARQWVLTYQGKHIVRAYRKRFGVDAACALRDLGKVGALSPEKLAEMQRAEQIRLERLRLEREERRFRPSMNSPRIPTMISIILPDIPPAVRLTA